MKTSNCAKTGMCLSIILATLSGLEADVSEYVYSEEGRTLTVTVGPNDTNTFDFAGYGAYLTGNAVTNFVKNGKGALICNSDLGAYLGDITVEAGTYTFTTNRALGKLSGEDVCGSVYVKNGATLDSHPATTKSEAIWGWFNKRICFEGNGVDGIGALIHTGDFSINRMVFSSNLVMTADAKIANLSSCAMYMSGGSYPVWLDMNGHTLIFEGNGQIAWGCWNVKNPGRIVSSVPQLTIQNANTCLNGDADNELAVKGGKTLTFNATSGSPIDWTLDASELSCISLAGGGGKNNTTNASYWCGPVLLGDSNVKVSLAKGYWFSLHGPVSGKGGFYAESYDGTPGQFNLAGSANSFEGGVGLLRTALGLWSNGALPPDGGALSMTNSSVLLCNQQDTYSLPDLKVVGKGRVAGGCGSWKSVEKIRAGELEWWSDSASDVLDVKEGTVWFRYSRRGIAGLIESERTYYPDNAAMGLCWDTVFTNIVTLSPAAYYDKTHHLWTDRAPDRTKPRFMLAYSGYIWNNESTNVTWSFAGAAGVHLNVRVDVTNAFKYVGAVTEHASTSYMFTMRDVTPGAHRIDIRGYQIDNKDTPPKASFPVSTSISLTQDANGPKLKWPETDFAVGFDPYGRGSLDQKDYIKLIDPGDGSLLTWALPEEVEPGVTTVPGTDKVLQGAPQFDRIAFADGTGMKSDYETVTVPELEGLPSVTGVDNTFSVTREWIIPADYFVGGSVLSTEGEFSLGEEAVVTITDDDRVGRNSGEAVFTVATAEGGITWPATVKIEGATREWKLFRSADNKTLYARHTPIGTIISLR